MKLKYPAADGTLSAIRAGQRIPLKNSLPSLGTAQSSPIGDDWTSITEELNEFRMSPYYWHFLDTANGAHDTVANFKVESSVMPHYIPFSGRRSYRLRRYWWCRLEKTRVIFGIPYLALF
jgi:hypothetical protein